MNDYATKDFLNNQEVIRYSESDMMIQFLQGIAVGLVFAIILALVF